jgi:hypothetical protein
MDTTTDFDGSTGKVVNFPSFLGSSLRSESTRSGGVDWTGDDRVDRSRGTVEMGRTDLSDITVNGLGRVNKPVLERVVDGWVKTVLASRIIVWAIPRVGLEGVMVWRWSI